MGPHYLLTFGTTLGKSRTIRINNADTTANDAAVRSSMNMLIASQAVEGSTGRINALRRAYLVETTITTMDLGL